MKKSIYRKNIDVQKHGSQFTVNAVQGETASRQLVITVQDGGKPFDFETDALTARVYGIKPDGTTFYNDCTIVGNVVTYNLTTQNVATAGDVRARIQITAPNSTNPTQILFSPEFTIYVAANDYTGAEPSADEYSELATLVTEAGLVNISMTEGTGEATITITDRNGDTDSVTIHDGRDGIDGQDGRDGVDGKDGKDGTNGQDGFSPSASVSRNLADTGAIITITDKDGTTSADVYDGQGGGTSFTVDDTLNFINSVLSVAFAQETQSGLETGKAVRSNEFNAAMNIINTTFGNFVSQLNGKQDTLNAGQNVSINNNVITAGIEVIKI